MNWLRLRAAGGVMSVLLLPGCLVVEVCTVSSATPATARLVGGEQSHCAHREPSHGLGHRGLVDLLDRAFQLGVELLVGLALGQAFEERAGEAGDEGGVAREEGTGLVAAVPPG